MYSVSQAYINKLKSVSKKRRRIRGTIDSIPFTENDILVGSFIYTDIAVKSADIKLGGVFIGSLNFTFLKSITSQIPRGTWKGRVINLSIGLLLGTDNNNQEIWEDVPLKPFTIDEANHSEVGIDIVAYDNMTKFNTAINFTSSVGTMFGFLTMATSNCNVGLGMTQQEIEALPNGTESFTVMTEDIETWRDLISELAVAMGGFATIDREGKLVLRNWSDTSVFSIGVNERFKGGSWSDFTTKYTSLTITNTVDGEASYYSMPVDDGMNMNIGANAFLQADLHATRDRQRTNVLQAIQKLRYIPFSSSSLIDPAFDLGDVIQCTGGIANNALCCVMRIDFSFRKGTTIKGYGKNPAMIDAKSASDKKITRVNNKAKDNSLTYYSFTNSGEIEINDVTQTTIIDIEFAVTAPTTVMTFHELKMLNHLADDTQTVTLYFYHNDDLVNYQPMNTYSEDECYHFFVSFYTLLNVMGGVTQRWRVTAQTSSGTADIDIGDAIATMFGQKMFAQDAFKGRISIDDEYTPIKRGRIIRELTDNMAPRQNPIISGLTPVTNARTTVDGNDRTVIGGDTRTIIQEE